jgi:bifunctional non-homologous end joining protein LigD
MKWRKRTESRRLRPPGFVEPCLPTVAGEPPAGPLWIHEIKHDGYRLLVRRNETGVRLLTRNGHDWTARFDWIIEAARGLRAKSFLIDGEAVLCGDDGVPDFDLLHSKGWDGELNGADLRKLPLVDRKAKLQRLLAKAARESGLSSISRSTARLSFGTRAGSALKIVSKRRDLPYRSGRSRAWIKVKNLKAPAAIRMQESEW